MQLSPEARELLDAVALLPEGAETTLLSTAFDEIDAAVDACVSAGLLVHDGQAITFRHELARQVVETAVVPTRRTRLHRRILAGLLETGGADAAVYAYHAELAGDAGAVVRFAPLAAPPSGGIGSAS